MIPRLPDRVTVHHTAQSGTSPEPWNREIQPELRAAISTLSNDKALSANALGRWEGLATHQIRTEPHAAVVVNALLYDAMTETSYRVLGVQKSSKHDRQGNPDHLICSCMIVRPGPEVR